MDRSHLVVLPLQLTAAALLLLLLLLLLFLPLPLLLLLLLLLSSLLLPLILLQQHWNQQRKCVAQEIVRVGADELHLLLLLLLFLLLQPDKPFSVARSRGASAYGPSRLRSSPAAS